MRDLQDKVTFYVPTENTEGKDLALTLAQEASERYGGATVTPAIGLWGGASEQVHLVTVFAERKDRAGWSLWVAEQGARIGVELAQEAVMFEVNGVARILERGVDYY